jgi:hypothetical protein
MKGATGSTYIRPEGREAEAGPTEIRKDTGGESATTWEGVPGTVVSRRPILNRGGLAARDADRRTSGSLKSDL